MKVPALLKNKYVCYGLMALAGLNVVGYVTVKSWECLALFLLTAYSAKSYTKNMSLAILAALFVSNIVFGCGRVKEGLEMQSPEALLKKAAAMSKQAGKKAKTAEGAEAAKDVEDAASEAAVFVASKEACCDKNGRKSGLDDLSNEKCDAGNFCM